MMNLYALIALIASGFTLYIGSLVLIKGKDNDIKFSFAALCFFIFCWQIGCFGQSYFLASPSLAILFDKIIYTGAIFAPIVFIQTVIIATRQFNRFKLLLLSGYIVGFGIFIINWVDSCRRFLFISHVAKTLSFRFIAIPNGGWYWFFAYYCILSSLILLILIKGLLRLRGKERERILFFAIASVFIVVAGYMYFGLVFNLNVPFAFMDNFFGIIYGIVMSYAILKHDLLDIPIVITRSGAFLIAFIIYIGLLGVSHFLPAYGGLRVFYAYFIFLLAGLTFNRLRLFLQTSAEKKFIRGYYRSEEIIMHIPGLLQLADDSASLRAIIEQQAFNFLEASFVYTARPDSLSEKVNRELKKVEANILELVKLSEKIVLPAPYDNAFICIKIMAQGDMYLYVFLGKRASEATYNSQDILIIDHIRHQLDQRVALIENI